MTPLAIEVSNRENARRTSAILGVGGMGPNRGRVIAVSTRIAKALSNVRVAVSGAIGPVDRGIIIPNFPRVSIPKSRPRRNKSRGRNNSDNRKARAPSAPSAPIAPSAGPALD